jgi:hypothetical protein
MFLAPLPYDYAALLDPGDRVRRTRKRSAAGSRVRRTTSAPRD